MAEKGAHLSSTVQNKPSIFDFVAQESLNKLLHPAVRKIADVLTLRFPESFGWLSRYYEETFLLFNFLIQYQYLFNYGSTFSENFYGLKRVPLKLEQSTNISSKGGLGKKELVLSLMWTTVFPYLKQKLENKVTEYRLEGSLSQEPKTIFSKKSVQTLHNSIHSLFGIASFVQHLRYISGKSDVNSPELWLAGVRLQYAPEDMSSDSPYSIKEFIPYFLKRGLEFGAFFVQFLQFWQTDNVTSIGHLPVPPPPPVMTAGVSRTSCPICHKERKIDTVLAVSGYVFCFKCIRKHLMESSMCPVTKLPATIDQLIRIYPPNS